MNLKNLKNNQKLKSQNGITLIALIITVIVMLILAGVSISVLTGADGLFRQTENAKAQYNNGVEKEKDYINTWTNKVTAYLEGTEDELIEVFTSNMTFDGKTTGTYRNPIIPKGFAPIDANDANWGSIDGYKEGLVIEDAIGNQFVWVPVNEKENVTFARQNWRNSSDKLLTWPTGKLIGTSGSNVYIEEVPEVILKSVKSNGGFYIARYEAGNSSDTVRDKDSNENDAAVSKAGNNVYNWINCEDSQTKAEAMYADGNEEYGVISTLIYGTQWDTALKFINAYSEDKTYATDSAGKGNYSSGDNILSTTEPTTCGALEVFKQKNIYDMAGNVWEWTMGAYNSNCVNRGGGYGNPGSIYPAASRNNNVVTNANINLGFRVGLYIK